MRQRCIRPITAAIGAWLALAGPGNAVASPCLSGTPESSGPAASVDPRTLRLQDGREIRLVGLEFLQQDENARAVSRQALDAVLKDRDLVLYAIGKPDRYGRLPAFVAVSGQTGTLQEDLLAAGHFALGLVDGDNCSAHLRGLEAGARNARRGVWSGTSALKNTETTGDILAMMGRFIVAEGKVLSARQAGATLYVNFGRRWTRDFAVIIARRDIPVFEKAGLSRLTLEGQTVRVRGWVVDQRGSPRIQATKPAQIEIVK
jgi:endonuclease YncB( thermonuclease family)